MKVSPERRLDRHHDDSRPVIDRVFRLDELAAARACSRSGRTAGKIAIAVR